MSMDYLVTLGVPPSLEDNVVDCLLTLESERGFSSLQINAHHHLNQGLSIAEQVTGRQKEIRFEIRVSEEGLQELLQQLRLEFSGSQLYYWVSPVLQSGVI